MNYFCPHDDLSQSLLKSIPKKIFYWLSNLGEDLSQEGTHGPLTWNFSPEDGQVTYCDLVEDLAITISWVGSPLEIQEIHGNDPRFCEIVNHLEWFTQVEQKIYSTLEDLSGNSSGEADYFANDAEPAGDR